MRVILDPNESDKEDVQKALDVFLSWTER